MMACVCARIPVAHPPGEPHNDHHQHFGNSHTADRQMVHIEYELLSVGLLT